MADISEWTQQAIQATEAMNLLGVLAVPSAYAQWRTQASPEELFEALRSRLAVLVTFCESARGSHDAERFRKAAPRVRAFAELLASTPPERLVDSDWSEQSRECLDALGLQTASV
jgi:hypothetical protein